jgi:hypothetical protein
MNYQRVKVGEEMVLSFYYPHFNPQSSIPEYGSYYWLVLLKPLRFYLNEIQTLEI